MYEFLIEDDNTVDTLTVDSAWQILIVDDEPAIHTVTKFALEDETFDGKQLSFISAYTAKEAKEILLARDDIALVLLDVVMEVDTAGLEMAAWIREELGNHLIRIILRTGQPGQAPEKTVILNYDIFDYKNKTELTAQKLFSCVISGLRSYRDVLALSNHSRGLKKVVETTADLFNKDILTICIANNKQRDQNKLKQCLQEGIVTNYEMVFQHTNGKHVEVRINATTQQTDNGIIITALCENITQSKKDLLRSDLLEQLLLATLKTNDADSLLSQTLDLLIANDLLEINNQGAVFKTTATGNQLALIYNINLANPLQKQCAILPFGRCHCGIAAQSGEIQFANCINDDHHITFEGMHPHGHYAIPIKLKGKVVYVIMLHLYDGVEPDPDNIKFLNAITDILTITLTRLQSEALLKQSNNQLEDRVEQRTLELASAVEKANQANQAKSVFLANMSHELRTPLHGILSFARFGLDKEHVQKPEKIHKYFDRINVSAERLLTLLNDLLDLAKLEAGKMSIEKQDYDLRTLVESSITEQEAWLAEKSLTVNWLDSTAETKAHFDAARISQVLMNLLSNAIKFSPSNTQLHFSISQDTLINQQTKAKVPALRFTLEDEGMGIPENELDSVFDKFVQSSKTHTGVMGTGLGLAICAEIIDAHNGKIWASSAENKGAQFSFIIPI